MIGRRQHFGSVPDPEEEDDTGMPEGLLCLRAGGGDWDDDGQQDARR